MEENLTKILVDKKGLSKWKIKQSCRVSWITVLNWYRGLYKPNKENQQRLKNLLDI